RVGFRTLRWNTEPDAAGRPFELIVNEQPVWVKGVNWIPDDALFPRVDRTRYERRLRQAASAGVNLVRVWGGGIYEDDHFYDLADELGLLTWQDFLFACAAYPEEEPLRSEVEAEARDNVARLAHHASLALLTGNNENLWGREDWGWETRLDGATWGRPTTTSCSRRSWPSSRRTCRTRRAARSASTPNGIRTRRRTARRTSGSSGTGGAGRRIASMLHVSSPSSAGRGRPPGPPSR